MDDVTKTAFEIFERLAGKRLMQREYHEIKPYAPGGIKLDNTPVLSLKSVKARNKSWMYGSLFGPTDWADMTYQASIYRKYSILLPHGIYGDFDEVDVTYVSGLDPIPDDLSAAIDEISAMLTKREITEWNVNLPDHILDVVYRYRHRKEDKTP